MRKIKYLLWPVLVIWVAGCNGPAVDKAKSENYYYAVTSRGKIYYSPMGNWFELGRSELKDADAKTFHVLGQFYAKDKNKVYYKKENIPEADVSTFAVFSIPGRQPQGITSDKDYYGKDQNFVFFDGKPLRNSFPQNFEFLISATNEPHRYAKDQGSVYWAGKNIPQADASTFTVLSGITGKDHNRVYQEDKVVEGADSNSMEIFKEDPTYVKDSKAIYHNSRQIEADPLSFVILGANFTKDRNHCYFNDQIIVDADPLTFERIKGVWARDGHHVFYQEMMLKDADPSTFVLLEEGLTYAKDKDRIYYVKWDKKVRSLKTLQTNTQFFHLLQRCGYSRDKDHIYYDLEIVSEADPATFTVREDSCHYGDDSARSFSRGKVITSS